MAERDITGEAVMRATEMVMKIRSVIDEKIPLGPNKVQVTPDEIEKNYANMNPEERQAFAASQGGIEDALEMMNGTVPRE